MNKTNRKKGKFITFEGPEGSGKSTQAKLLVRYLKSKGQKAIFLREPGGTVIGEKIRGLLLNKKNSDICPMTEMLLYMAARAQVIQEVIKPQLREGYFVVCDRFLDSTLVYQGRGLGVNLSLIKHLGNFLIRETKPDLTIFLDVSVKRGLAVRGRLRKLDRIEERSISYHQRVRRGYIKLVSKYPKRIKVIKPHKDKNKTQDKIRKLI